ncbi:MAG: lipopolysaccharide biosynthesis protein [Actinomycetales bacterium]|nr:lipopolysaccharide biosynthesis protein [Candidatus Phosphoribacter baldrii]
MSHGGSDSAADLQRRAVRGALWTFIHLGVSLPLGFVVNLVVARHLGVVDFGRLATLTLAVDITVAIAGVGMGSALVQFGAKAHSAGRRTEVHQLLRAAQGYQLLVQFPLVTASVLVLSSTFGLPVSAMVWVWLFGVLLPALTAPAAACFGIENRGDLGAKLAMASSVVSGLASIAVVMAGGSAALLWGTRLCVAGLLPAVALWLIAKDYRRAICRPTPPRLPGRFWRFALPTGLASLAGMAVSSRIEVFALTWSALVEAAGLYALAFGLAAHAFAPAQALAGPLLAAIAALREVSAQAARPAFERALRASSAVAGLLVAGAIPALAALVPMLYGSAFAAAGPLLVVLGAAGGFGILNGPLGVFAQSRLAGRLVLRAAAAALVVDVGAALALVPHWAAWGAVAATTAGTLVQFVVLSVSERADLGVGVWEFSRLIAPLLLALPVSGLATWLSAGVTSVVAGALCAGTSGLVIWVLLVRLSAVGLRPSDAAAIVASLPEPLRAVGHPLLRAITSKPGSQRA